MTGISKPKKVEAEEGNSLVSLLLSILKGIAEFKGWELIFQGLMFTFFIWAIYNLQIVYEFQTGVEWAHIPKFSIYDFKLALIFVAVFLGYKTACNRIFFNMIKSRLDPVKFPTEEDRNARAKNSCNWVGNIIYYTCSTIAAFLLFKDQDFFPKELGGKADPVMMYEGFPSIKQYPYAVMFYMIQFGRHLHTLVDYCVYKWRDPKFWEMFLHHNMAVFLIFFSFLVGGMRFGIIVMFVHDPSDVFLCLGRLFADFKNHSWVVQYFNVVGLIFTWIFFRLYAFPKCVISSGISYFMVHDVGRLTSPVLFMTLMAAALVVLHFYWFVFIIRIVITILRGKKNYNSYDTTAKNQDDVAIVGANNEEGKLFCESIETSGN
jgi:hypothetical protein